MATTLSTSTSYLQDLISTGADAQSNLYKITFSNGSVFGKDDSVTKSLTVRASDFNPPSFKPKGTYSVRFVNAYINRPLASTEVTRQFEVTFRLDSNYDVYRYLRSQRDVTFDPEQGFTATNITKLKDDDKLFNVDVNILNNVGGSETTIYKYKHCWISQLTSPSYTTDSSKEATVKATIKFLEMEVFPTTE